MAKKNTSQNQLNHHTNQLNSNNTNLSHNNSAYKSTTVNHGNQQNPNNPAFKGKK